MKMFFKATAIIIGIFVFTFFNCFASAAMIKDTKNNGKLLVIVQETAQIADLNLSEYEDVYDIVQENFIDYESLKAYSAFAVRIEALQTDIRLKKILASKYYKENSEIYIYGELTIHDYEEIFEIDNLGSYIDLYSTVNLNDSKNRVFAYYDNHEKQTRFRNIISSSGSMSDKYLIANIECPDLEDLNKNCCRRIIYDYYQDHQSIVLPLSVIQVQSGYDYVAEYITDSFGFAINMDYRLYKETESDPNYEYFAIKQFVTVEEPIHHAYVACTKIIAEQDLYYASDEMIDYGPFDATNAGSVEVSLDMSSGVGLTYSFLVGGSPEIDATYSAINDYVQWKITNSPTILQPGNLYIFSTSWAVPTSRSITAIDLDATMYLSEYFILWWRQMVSVGVGAGIVFDY